MTCAHPLVADGFRADSSSPFILRGELIGNNAIWQLLIGPVDSETVATIRKVGDEGSRPTEHSTNVN